MRALPALLLLFGTPLLAHNGAVAIAVPADGIVVDGDLSDWPTDMVRYPMSTVVRGDPPSFTDDGHGSFTIAYDPDRKALYVGIKAPDPSVVTGSASAAEPPDCSIALDLAHDTDRRRASSFRLVGDSLSAPHAGIRARSQRQATGYRYEWMIDIAQLTERDVTLQPGMVFGFGVELSDTGADGSRTALVWGSRAAAPGRNQVGDVVLASADADVAEVEHLLGVAIQDLVRVHGSVVDRARSLTTYQMLLTGILLAIAVVHGLLYVFYPEARTNLYYSLFLMSTAAFVFLDVQLRFGPIAHFTPIGMAVMLLLSLSGLLTVYSISHGPIPGVFRWLAGVGVAGYALTFVLDRWILVVTNGLTGVVMLEVLRSTVVGLRNRREGALILAAGVVGTVAMFGVFRGLVVFDVFESPDIVREWTLVGVLPAVVAMSIHLGRGFGATNRDLQRQVTQVERLSRQALEHERTIREQEVERRLLESELDTAREMQMALMPRESPPVAGLDVSARCTPAAQVGGDFFQYFHRDGLMSIAAADVTGHAMQAAIPVVMFNGILDQLMESTGTLEERFLALNRSMCRSLDGRTFVCFTMAEIDTGTRKLRVASCGSPYPLLYRAADGAMDELQVDAYPLGVRPDTTYSVLETQLEPGDRLVLYSDGIPESVNADGEMFGFEATAATVQAACAAGASAEEVIERLVGATRQFAGHEPQADDMTCVVVRVEG